MSSASLHQALRSASISAAYAQDEIDPLTALVHHNMVQTSMLRVAGSKFAQANKLNDVDFTVMCQAVSLSSSNDRGATPGQLSEDLSLSASTLTSILERLMDRGLIMRDRDPADRRRITVVPTDAAWDMIEEYYKLVRRAYEAVFSNTDKDTLVQMNQALDDLRTANSAALAQLDALLDHKQGKVRGRPYSGHVNAGRAYAGQA